MFNLELWHTSGHAAHYKVPVGALHAPVLLGDCAGAVDDCVW